MVNYSYNAWGVLFRSVNSSLSGDLLTQANLPLTHNPFVYKGYFYDSETGYYYLKSRYYDPRIHRFLSADKIDYLDPKSLSSLNLYVYCGDNPVMGYDPSGQKWWDWIMTGTAVILTGIVTIAAVTASIASFGIAPLIAAALAGGVFGGLYAGISSANEGKTGWDLISSIALGTIGGAIMGIGSLVGILPALSTGFLVGFSLDSLSQMASGSDVNYLRSVIIGMEAAGLNLFTIHSMPGSDTRLLTHLAANMKINSIASLYGFGLDVSVRKSILEWADDTWNKWTNK